MKMNTTFKMLIGARISAFRPQNKCNVIAIRWVQIKYFLMRNPSPAGWEADAALMEHQNRALTGGQRNRFMDQVDKHC